MRAIVTGASSGIGLEVAKILIEQGWTVGVAARRAQLLQNIGAAAIERIDVTLQLGHEGYAERLSTGLGATGTESWA